MSTGSQVQPNVIREIDERCDNIETAPLLNMSLSELHLAIAKHDSTESYIHVAKREIKWMASSSSLTTMTMVLRFSFNIANILSVSHLGTNELGALTLALSCQAIIALAPITGLLSAMDTFCSTAFTASHDKTLVGFHFQRGLIAVCAHCVLVAPILWNAEYLLLFIRQDPEIAHLAGVYLRIHVLSMADFAPFEATKRYLQAQGIMRAGTIVTMVVAPIHWISSYMLVRSSRFGMGFVGAPIANAVSQWLLLIGILLYTLNSRAMEAWGGWKLSAFRNMWDYYRLAIPAVITICAEWVSLEMLVFGASYFGANQLAGQAIVLNFLYLIFQFSNGLGYSTSPRIGNLIGAANPRQARVAADMSILVSTCFGILGVLFFSLRGDWLILTFASSPSVAREATRLVPIACVLVVSNGLNGILSAIIRGLGRQKISANILTFAYYVCSLPVAIHLGYIRHLETPGIWWGWCIGVILASVLQIAFIYLWIDWKDEVRLCLLRLKGKNSQATSGTLAE